MTTTTTSGAADLRATFSEMLVDLPNTEPYTLFQAGFDAALAAGQATAAQAVVEPADTVVLNAAMRAIQQAIELIGAPTDERMRAVRRVLRGAVIVAEDDGKVAPLPSTAYAALPESFLEIPDVQDESGINAYYSREVVLECIDAALASRGQAPASVLHLVHSAFAEIAMAFPKAFALHKVGIADTAVREALTAIQGEMNVQLDIDSNHSAPGQQRDVARSVALGQPMGNGQDQAAGRPSAQGYKLLTVAERNIRSFLRSATFKSESDREAALNCVDVLWAAARDPADSVQEDAACWHWLAEYLVGTRTDLDDEIVASETVNDLRKLVEAARKQGEKHDR